MDFDRTESQEAVRTLATSVLGGERPTSGRGWFDEQAWSGLADAGLLGIALPEDVGGSGQGLLELHELLVSIGASAAAVPAWETLAAAAPMLAGSAREPLRSALLRGVAGGDTILTVAIADGDPREPQVTARETSDGFSLHGLRTVVPAALIAERILVPARTSDGGTIVIALAPVAAGVDRREQESIGGVPHAELVLDDVEVTEAEVLVGATVEDLVAHAAMGIASVQAGACASALRLAAAYTSEREQFGRPIATFQAVAHRLADAYIDAEAVRLTALQAAWRLAEGLPAADEAAIAAWWAAEAGHRVLHAALHVHGGIGVDRDYPLHRYFLLTKRLELALGGARRQLLHLGSALAAEPG